MIHRRHSLKAFREVHNTLSNGSPPTGGEVIRIARGRHDWHTQV